MHLFASQYFPYVELYAHFTGLLSLYLREDRVGLLVGDDPERVDAAAEGFGGSNGRGGSWNGPENSPLFLVELEGEPLIQAIRACFPLPLPDVALAVRQPWATFLVNYLPDHPVLRRLKNIENREWALPRHYWGKRVFILASRRPEWDIQTARLVEPGPDPEALELLPFLPGRGHGGIVGAVEFDAEQPSNGDRCKLGECLSPGPWGQDGYFHWRITRAWALPFLPCRGQLKFFPVNYWVRGLGEDVGGWVREIIGGAA